MDQGMPLLETVVKFQVNVKCWESPDKLHNWRFLKKDSAPFI
jgi:hypothetical protein